MNIHIVTNTNDEIINMPSLPMFLNKEVSHYCVDVGCVEKHTIGNEELAEKDSVD